MTTIAMQLYQQQLHQQYRVCYAALPAAAAPAGTVPAVQLYQQQLHQQYTLFPLVGHRVSPMICMSKTCVCLCPADIYPIEKAPEQLPR
jgi:hypothetical protein